MRKINLGLSTQNLFQRPEPAISMVCLIFWLFSPVLLPEFRDKSPSVPVWQPAWCFPAGSCSSAGQGQHSNLLAQFASLGPLSAAPCPSLPAPAASPGSSWSKNTWELPVLHGKIQEFLPGIKQQDRSTNGCGRERGIAALHRCDLVLAKQNPNPGSAARAEQNLNTNVDGSCRNSHNKRL